MPYRIADGDAEISHSDAAELVGRLTTISIAMDFDHPTPPGQVITTTARRTAGVGPWTHA